MPETAPRMELPDEAETLLLALVAGSSPGGEIYFDAASLAPLLGWDAPRTLCAFEHLSAADLVTPPNPFGTRALGEEAHAWVWEQARAEIRGLPWPETVQDAAQMLLLFRIYGNGDGRR